MKSVEFLFVNEDYNWAVGLDSQWWDFPEKGFYIHYGAFPELSSTWLEEVLSSGDIEFTIITSRSVGAASDLSSPDGKWIARPLGIYNAVTDELILPVPLLDYPSTRLYCVPGNLNSCNPDFRPCCWSPDSQSIVYRFVTDGHSFPPLYRFQIGSPHETAARGNFWMPVLRVHLSQE